MIGFGGGAAYYSELERSTIFDSPIAHLSRWASAEAEAKE